MMVGYRRLRCVIKHLENVGKIIHWLAENKEFDVLNSQPWKEHRSADMLYVFALTTNDRYILIGYLYTFLPLLLEMALPQLSDYLSTI
jgi:hypothetical protein